MPRGFGYGERFKSEKKTTTPGPGAYDPKEDVGFKADPKSGFVGGERFSSQELEESTERSVTPPRQRQIVSPGSNRKFSWAAQRIHELQEELARINVRCKELEDAAKLHHSTVEEVTSALEKANQGLESAQSKLQQSEGQRTVLEKELQQCKSQQAQTDQRLAAETAAHESVQEQLSVLACFKQQLEGQLERLTTAQKQQQEEQAAHVLHLQSTLTEQRTAFQQLQTKHATTKHQLAVAAAHRDELELKLTQSVNESAELSSQVSTCHRQLESKHDTLVLTETKLSQANTNISCLSATLQETQSTLSSTAAQVKSLQGSLVNSQRLLKDRESTIGQLTTQVKLLELQKAAAQEAAAALREHLQDALVGSQESVQHSEELTADITSLTDLTTQLGQRLQLTLEELAAARQVSEALTQALHMKSEKAADLEATIMNLQHDLQKQGELVTQLTDRKAELQLQLENLHSEYSQMQVDMVNENMKAKQLAIELESSKSLLRSALEESSAQREDNYTLLAEVDKLKAELANKRMMQQEMDSMRDELADAYRQISSAQARERVLDEKANKMSKELAEVQLSNASVDQQVQVLQQLLEAERQRADEANQRAEQAEAKSETSQTMVLEMHRLMDDNELLAGRLAQMESDLKELLSGGSGTGGLGHNNAKQKIQYHLRLKQELEELRSKCTWLLREKFHLEQCVRYLSVRARIVEDRTPVLGGRERKATELVLPDSLAPTHHSATPLGQKAMRAGARSRNSTFSHQTREQLEDQINSTRLQMVKDIEGWKNGLDPNPDLVSSPVIGTATYPSPNRSPAPSPRAIVRTTTPTLIPSELTSGDTSVESRILARVASVMCPLTRPVVSSSSRENSRQGSFNTGMGREDSMGNRGSTIAEDGNEEQRVGKSEREALGSPSSKGSSRIPKAPMSVKV